jgi:4-alpha-glucanotransferase
VIDPELIARAEAAGIETSYENWQRRHVDVPAETLQAILAALAAASAAPGMPAAAAAAAAVPMAGRPASGGAMVAAGASASAPAVAVARAADEADGAGGAAGELVTAPGPERRGWGFTVQLYSVRSRQSWGHGDLRDLAELAAWSGGALGAAFVLVNPLHAAEPRPPVSASPYLPMTRRYCSPLYLRVEDVPEYARLPAPAQARIGELAAPLRAQDTEAALIDRDAVWTAKRAALELVREVELTPARRAAFAAYREREGDELRYWAAWCALAERHGPDWRTWPADLQDREAGLAAVFAGPGVAGDPAGTVRPAGDHQSGGGDQSGRDHQSGGGGQSGGDHQSDRSDQSGGPGLGEAADFHAWLQWLVDDQLAAAQEAALAAGMAVGVLHDLAVGVHPGGADAWAHQDLLVRGISVGAPPDSFNQRGQDWAQPPWNPQRLAAAEYTPLAELFAAAFRHAGGLRIDHVMGLMRLWWVPEGMPADQGAYVRYDHEATVAALVGAARAAGGVAIGEDLGTVEEWIRSYLASRAVLGTEMLWFAQERDGSPLRPDHWRRDCMATVGTHDVPPVAGFLTGDQVTERARLGLLTAPEPEERQRAAGQIAAWCDALEVEGLLPPGARRETAEVTVALYGYLARTPARLIGVSLADSVGDVRSQNIPGTSDEYPNWQIPLCDATGRPVLLEDLPALPLLLAVARAASVG